MQTTTMTTQQPQPMYTQQPQQTQQQQQQPTQIVIQQQPQVVQPVMVGGMLDDDPTPFYIMIALTWILLGFGMFTPCAFCCIDPVFANQPKKVQAKKWFWISYGLWWLVAIIVSITVNA